MPTLSHDPDAIPYSRVVCPALQRIIERMLMVIVKCATDAGELWLAEHGRPPGASVLGVFHRLHEAGLLTPELVTRFAGYSSTRNRVVYAYDRLDTQQTLNEAGHLVGDARALLVALTAS